MFEYRIGDCIKPLADIYPELVSINDSIVLSKPLLGSIFWHNFGSYNGSVQGGTRPCVVIHNFAQNNQDISNVLPLTTSHKAPHLPVHVVIKANELNGLQKDSTVLCEQIQSVKNDSLFNPLGILNHNEFRDIEKARKIQAPLESLSEEKMLKRYFDSIIPIIKRIKAIS